MAIKSMLLLLVLVVICAELPRSYSFKFTKWPNNPLVVYYYKNKTNVELRWEWNLEGGIFFFLKIERYRKDNPLGTETQIAKYYSSGTTNVEETKYGLSVQNRAIGSVVFTIKEITNQGINEGKENGEKSRVDVMEANKEYIYSIEVDEQTSGKAFTNSVALKMLKTPVITTYPNNQTVTGGDVTFECVADGKPKPTITWDKIGSSQALSQGSPLTLKNFEASNIGVYRCTAKSNGIAETANATGFVQFSTCGPGCDKEELAIEFTDLTYNNEYDNPSFKKYKELKNKIETECLTAYALKGKTIHKCEVVRYRKGSVVAVLELGYPTNTLDPKEPLLQAINDGNFAGYKVITKFVSPTSPPTEKPSPTAPTTPTASSNTPPASGARTNESGLSKGAIIALVVVFSIIFIVIIVVLIVCMLKKKKPSDTRNKPYKEDGRTYDKSSTTVPLKSQPFDPMYDDPNEDRYPNGGGPPPQYTPSNYAEVKPNQPDDSQVEWDKSVKDEMWI
ncbi:uncharacterized protein LOC116306472 isoform X2 [Actinia tenebrosa]|uniref:Uncharacterized protein LOC116306472 isoform X2 n=1 Tax=Actinia tenebrosa TaxID=6105 RepID=A0A6P8IZ00_ACTTE|nr:uncharacterized protein LOC116306472 isoform X2 [Actinia tenebrosa]